MSISKLAKNVFKNSDFTQVQTVIAAVSGGSDSLALLFLLKEYLSSFANHVRLVAITIDHQLRAESSEEAAWVKKICEKNAIEHVTLCWSNAKPLSAVSFQARLARYNLLYSAAEDYQHPIIMTGHTLNDQAETYWMRLQRGSSRGLAAMPRESLLMGKIKLVRPLLEQRRECLREYLQSFSQHWVDDPSNENLAYERVRVRKAMTEQDIVAAQKNIAVAAEKRRLQAKETAALISLIKPQYRYDIVTLSDITATRDHQQFGFLLAVLAAIQGGSLYLPNDGQTRFLQENAFRSEQSIQRMSLCGAILEKSKLGIRIWRENRNLPSNDIGPGKRIIWDGRFDIRNHSLRTINAHAASQAELKSVINHLALVERDFHFSSLQTSLCLRGPITIDIPVLSGNYDNAATLSVERFLNPFGWMVSGDDFVLVNALIKIYQHGSFTKIKPVTKKRTH